MKQTDKFRMPRSTCLLFFGSVMLVFAACSSPSREGGSVSVSGEVLFKAKQCYGCHSIGHGPMAGPDLKGLFQRRTETWVREYISDPIRMVQEDPTARALKQRYQIQMPKLNLSAGEMDALILYLKTATRE